MTFGYRSKLFALNLASTLMLALMLSIGVDQALMQWAEDQQRAGLARSAQAAHVLIEHAHSERHARQLLSRFGARAGVQVVLQPITSTTSPSPRSAPTTRVVISGTPMEIRVTRSPEPDEDPMRQVRLILALVSLMGLLSAVLLTVLATRVMTRTLGALLDYARALSGEVAAPVSSDRWRDLAQITASSSALTEELEGSVQTLARERDRISAVLETMHEAVIALDARYQITLMNRAAREFLAPQLSTLARGPEGERLTDLVKLPALLELIEGLEAGEAQAAKVTEFSLPGPPPRRVAAHLSANASRGYVLVLHDVTELRKLEVMRRDFMTNISHELRTPVSVIQSTSETLLDGAIDDPHHARGFVDAIHRNAERLGRLIHDLLDISRLESGRMALHPEPVSLFGVSLHVIDTLERKIQDHHLEIELDVDMDMLVLADPKALDQIVFNLIDNAIKYTPAGGVIEVRASRQPSKRDPSRQDVRLEVIDQGPGLDAEHRNRVFERFYRVDKGRSRDQGGTGLGLSIVKHLAQAMSGRVGVRPNEPRGCIFWVRLPDVSGTIELDD